jgi:MoaA/NifB/PqqE/SkfB family radical SAM enzyme
MENVHIVAPTHAGVSSAAARIEALRRIPASHLATRPPAPRAAKIELTARCNYTCAFCEQPSRAHPRGEMRWPLFTRIVGEMADAGVRELGLQYLGEPFLCEWLPDAIGHAKARGIAYAYVVTNGSAATSEAVKACMEAGLDSLEFSVDFADNAQFRELAGTRPALFRDALGNLRAARHARDAGRYACALIASSLRHDERQEERMAPLLAEVLPYVDEHYWRPPHARGPAQPIPCESLFSEALVAFDGTLSACQWQPGDAYAMADLAQVPFMDGWHSERFARLRDAHLRRDLACTACEECGPRP